MAVLGDDLAQSDVIVGALALAGHTCFTYPVGRALLSKLRQETFDLLILDWNVPDLSGLEIVAWTRSHLSPPPPTLMVTARADARDIVAGLNAGADDFLVKPIEPSILLARIHALLRRAHPAHDATRSEVFGPVAFEPLRQRVTVSGQEAQLTSKEFALALLLFRNMHRALGRTYLLEALWGRSPDLATRTLDAHISKIRGKLRLRPENGFKLAPVYSYGYRLERVTASGTESTA